MSLIHKLSYIALMCLAIISTAASLSPTLANSDAPTQLNYDVIRGGKVIGTHSLNFARNGSVLTVDIKTDVQVKIAFITAYRFIHRGSEVWENGRLMQYRSTTDDDGKDKHLTLQGNEGGYIVDSNADRYETKTISLPASLWHADTPKQTQLMNTLDGHVMNVTIQDMGMAPITARGQQINAHHYKMTGDLERELWYHEGQLVHLRFKGGDGSTIDYLLR